MGTDWVRSRWQTTRAAAKQSRLSGSLRLSIITKMNDPKQKWFRCKQFVLSSPCNRIFENVTNALYKKTFEVEKHFQMTYQSVKSPFWKVTCWLWHFFICQLFTIFDEKPVEAWKIIDMNFDSKINFDDMESSNDQDQVFYPYVSTLGKDCGKF